MAIRADLEAKEAQCKSLNDFIHLAREALDEPTDADYAKELLQKA